MSRPLIQSVVRKPFRYAIPAGSGFDRQRLPGWSRIMILSILCCLLVPRGVELQLGSIMIDIPRILLTIFSLMAVSQLTSGKIKIRITPADWLISAHILIIAFSAVYHGGSDVGLETTYQTGFGKGLETASGVLIDMGLAYFVARVAIHNLVCYRYYVRIVIIIAAVSAAFALVEMFTGFSPLRAAYHIFFPKVTDVYLVTEKRLGFYRAAAAFRVSLLFGLYCAIAFAVAVYIKPNELNMKKWIHRFCLAFCAVGVFASLSSGSWLSLLLCLFCLIYDRITGNIHGKWKFLLFAGGLGLFFISIVSNRGPFKLIIDNLTIDSQTGYVRLAMWDCVWTLMQDYWLIGWGWSSNWPRSVDWYIWSSIDSFYAVYLVRSGIFAVLSIIGFLVYCWYRLSNFSGRKYVFVGEARGWIIATVCLFITALTVDIFGTMIFATYFLLGAGQTLLAANDSALRYNSSSRTVGAARYSPSS